VGRPSGDDAAGDAVDGARADHTALGLTAALPIESSVLGDTLRQPRAARLVHRLRVEHGAWGAASSEPSGSHVERAFGQLLTDWEDRHRDGVQESTMRDYRPGLNDLRQALGGVLARSLTDEDLAADKRAKFVGIDVGGGEASPRTGSN
jgi:hypothetical protein